MYLISFRGTIPKSTQTAKRPEGEKLKQPLCAVGMTHPHDILSLKSAEGSGKCFTLCNVMKYKSYI